MSQSCARGLERAVASGLGQWTQKLGAEELGSWATGWEPVPRLGVLGCAEVMGFPGSGEEGAGAMPWGAWLA